MAVIPTIEARMRPLVLTAVFLLGWLDRVQAEEDPRDLIARAIQARGGAVAARPMAMRAKIKGVLHMPGGLAVNLTGSFARNGPDGPARIDMQMDLGGQKYSVIQVNHGARSWLSAEGNLLDVDPATLEAFKDSEHAERVSSLTPLLRDKAFALTNLGEKHVEGRAALAVKAVCKGQKDVLLYFDKKSLLLVKMEHRTTNLNERKLVTRTTLYSRHAEPDWRGADERLLRRANVAVDGPGLLAFLGRHIPTGAGVDRIKELVRQLGDPSFEVREKATEALQALGKPAAPWLRLAANDPDAEISRRAKQCLENLKEDKESALVAAAVRLVGWRQPPEATDVLLAFLAHPGDEEVMREVESALAVVAVKDGKPNPALLKALEAKEPRVRAVAAGILGRDGGAWERQPGRRLYVPGLKMARKEVSFNDGVKESEIEAEEIQFFNRLEEQLFVKPATPEK